MKKMDSVWNPKEKEKASNFMPGELLPKLGPMVEII